MRKPVNLNSLRILNIFYCENNTYNSYNFTEIKEHFKGSNTTLLNLLKILKKIGAIKEKQLSKFPFTKDYSITKYGIKIHLNLLKILSEDYIPGDGGE